MTSRAIRLLAAPALFALALAPALDARGQTATDKTIYVVGARSLYQRSWISCGSAG
jgi:hypothetical protein